MEAAIAITDDCIGETDLTSAESRYMLGQINAREGDLKSALKFMRQALDIRLKDLRQGWEAYLSDAARAPPPLRFHRRS